ncbi:MAG: ribonuclease D, partial [Candidatus Dormibacteria bacterium]
MIGSIVDDGPSLAALCTRLETAPRIALDTEFHNEKTYAARLMVVQLAAGDDVFIIDPLRIGDLAPLADLLARKTVVGHALSSDLKILADRFGRLPAAAFDTQLAAAFCGYGMQVSLAELVARLVDVRLRKSQTVSDWSARPFSPQQQEYLVDDVRYLFELQDRLTDRLTATGRLGWYDEEARPLIDPAKYRPDPERLYLRVSGATRLNRRELGILRELANLRESLARERDVPVKYILADDVLAGLVHLRPRTVEELAQLRRFDAGARRAFGERVIAAVERGVALDEADLPRKPPRPPGGDRDAIAAAIAVLVGSIAEANQLPPSLLLPRSAI